jgi:hypothetical protein
MKTPKLTLVTSLCSLLVAAATVAGCDTEAPPSPDETAAIAQDSDADDPDVDHDGDDGDDGDERPALGLVAPGSPASRHGSALDPCGNAVLDAGEECDDGLANGNDRECTYACELNDCELDAHGVCEDHWPAADVDLYPCADLANDYDRCGLTIAQ